MKTTRLPFPAKDNWMLKNCIKVHKGISSPTHKFRMNLSVLLGHYLFSNNQNMTEFQLNGGSILINGSSPRIYSHDNLTSIRGIFNTTVTFWLYCVKKFSYPFVDLILYRHA